MSKCAQNMMGKLFALDVKPRGIAIVCLHPGFMKTTMTEIYADKYDELGAIGPEEAAPGIVKVMNKQRDRKVREQAQPRSTAELLVPRYN